jgi:hypothetical protein
MGGKIKHASGGWYHATKHALKEFPAPRLCRLGWRRHFRWRKCKRAVARG